MEKQDEAKEEEEGEDVSPSVEVDKEGVENFLLDEINKEEEEEQKEHK